MRQGLRNPYAHTSGRAPLVFTNGLSVGTRYALPFAAWSTSIRSTDESRSLISWPVFNPSGGLGDAPSPVDIYRNPSGPNCRLPPLCPPDFQVIITFSDVGSMVGGCVSRTLNRDTLVPSGKLRPLM